jgi:hypothetical protein
MAIIPSSDSESELSYFMTGGLPPISWSGAKALEHTTREFIFQLNPCDHGPYVIHSLTRGWVCHLQLLVALASTVILRSKSHETYDQILLSQIWDSPNLEGQVPVFISPRNRVAQLYPQALDSIFVTSCDLQGYGRGIRPCLNTGCFCVSKSKLLYGWRFTASQFILASSPLRPMTRVFFFFTA